MTRFEYIKTLDQKQMAHYLCFQFTECSHAQSNADVEPEMVSRTGG